MPHTPTVGLPYPVPTDPADVPADIEALAMTLDELLAPKPETPPGMELIWDSVDAAVALPVAGIEAPVIPATFKHRWSPGSGRAASRRGDGLLGVRLSRQRRVLRRPLGNCRRHASAGLAATFLRRAAARSRRRPATAAALIYPSYTAADNLTVLARCGGFTGASRADSWVACSGMHRYVAWRSTAVVTGHGGPAARAHGQPVRVAAWPRRAQPLPCTGPTLGVEAVHRPMTATSTRMAGGRR